VNALVLGADGQLGSELVRLIGADAAVTHGQVSITDERSVDELVAARRPPLVFNCAAYNAVDRAETETDAAFAVNATGPATLAAVCARHGARLIHFSTNFVFDGTLDRAYLEADAPAPLGAYARSKLEGEARVLEAMPGALVIRTAAVFGGNRGQSFPERILARAGAGHPLRVVSDQRVNPTYAKDLASSALALAGQGMEGVVHLVAAECCAWDEFARAVLAECGVPLTVESISSDDSASQARRPRNGCLSSLRVGPLRPWRSALQEWAAKRRLASAAGR